jgi:predicted DNA binding CopG/RHH family protein
MEKIKYNDTEAELNLFSELEKGNFKSVSGVKKEKDRIKKIIKGNFYSEKKIINIRLLNRDVEKIKALAIKEGIPYQVLIRSVIHKYVENNI